MAHCNCKLDNEVLMKIPFTSCDGTPISDEILQLWKEIAVEGERYEFAELCKQEQDRRLAEPIK